MNACPKNAQRVMGVPRERAILPSFPRKVSCEGFVCMNRQTDRQTNR